MQNLLHSEPPAQADIVLLRRMNGSSQSLLVRDRQRRLWVVKLNDASQRENTLANEFLGTHLCKAIGLPVPDVKVIEIADSFFDDSRTWLRAPAGSGRPAGGLHFASRFFPEMSGTEAIEFLLPGLRSSFRAHGACLGMLLFDAWAMHADARQALFFAGDAGMHAIFIDHGDLFGGADWTSKGRFLGGSTLHQFALQEYERDGSAIRWITRMQERLPKAFEEAAAGVPKDWYIQDIQGLQQRFIGRLQSLPEIVAEAVQSARSQIEVVLASEQRRADSQIRVLSQRGADLWL